MSQTPIEPKLLERYLGLLGVRSGPADLELLRRIVRAHLQRVPFESVSKLYRVHCLGLGTMPGLGEFLHDVEQYNLGGTCYTNNTYLWHLLRQLGFDASLCGADMSEPDVHEVILVRLGGRELMVDVGYAAPFYEPLARDAEVEQVVAFGNERYVLWPRDAGGRSRLDHERDGERIHGYVVNPQPREPEHFARVVHESYLETSTFMKSVMVRRFFDGHSVTIRDRSLVFARPHEAVVTRLPDHQAMVDAIVEHCQVDRRIVEPALAGFAGSYS